MRYSVIRYEGKHDGADVFVLLPHTAPRVNNHIWLKRGHVWEAEKFLKFLPRVRVEGLSQSELLAMVRKAISISGLRWGKSEIETMKSKIKKKNRTT